MSDFSAESGISVSYPPVISHHKQRGKMMYRNKPDILLPMINDGIIPGICGLVKNVHEMNEAQS